MRHLILSTLIVMGFGFQTAQAANTQHSRMIECNKRAKGMKGDERKAFMKKCLSGKTDVATNASAETAPGAPALDASANFAPTPGTPQERMKDCNVKAKGMKGDERKNFMSTCLQGQ